MQENQYQNMKLKYEMFSTSLQQAAGETRNFKFSDYDNMPTEGQQQEQTDEMDEDTDLYD